MKPPLAVILILSACLWEGCTLENTPRPSNSLPNVYRAVSQLPPELHRIAVLPVTVAATDLASEEGRDALEPILYAELQKRAVAELVVVTRDELWNLTGRREWRTIDALPADFFERLHQATGCDAYVFCDLTYFRAYPPLEIGWKLQLVDVRKRTLWAVDEAFDASNASVAAAACHYGGATPFWTFSEEAGTILESPRQFGRYAAATVLKTMPTR